MNAAPSTMNHRGDDALRSPQRRGTKVTSAWPHHVRTRRRPEIAEIIIETTNAWFSAR
jgi:hypothetical protein